MTAPAEIPSATYKWQLYADHGIDTASDAFHAAMFAASDAAYVQNALCVLLCNLRAITGDEAEVIRCVVASGSHGMGVYLRDVFPYAFAAPEAERGAFARGLVAYAKAAFAGSVKAQAAFQHSNGHNYGKWTRTFDLSPWFSVCELVRGKAATEPDPAESAKPTPPPPDWNAAARVAAEARFGWEDGAA